MPKSKEEKQAEKARRAVIRALGIELVLLMATASGKADRYRAAAQSCRQAADVLDAMASESA